MKEIPLFFSQLKPRSYLHAEWVPPAQLVGPAKSGLVALVDDADYDWLMAISSVWYADKPYRFRPAEADRSWYVRAATAAHPLNPSRNAHMHRIILQAAKGTLTDHRDRNGLNNQRANLRFCTSAQNAQNHGPHQRENKASPYKGVAQQRGKWMAVCQASRIVHRRYGFATPEDAARAYDEMAQKLHGEFAYLNFGGAA